MSLELEGGKEGNGGGGGAEELGNALTGNKKQPAHDSAHSIADQMKDLPSLTPWTAIDWMWTTAVKLSYIT